jgi:hypothetical protein
LKSSSLLRLFFALSCSRRRNCSTIDCVHS